MNTKLSSRKESKTLNENSRFSLSNSLRIRSATTRNLREFALDIPKQTVSLIHGPSRSGKSAILIDSLYKESNKRLNILFHNQTISELDRNESSNSIVENLSPVIGRKDSDLYHSKLSLFSLLGMSSVLAETILEIGKRICSHCGQEMNVSDGNTHDNQEWLNPNGKTIRVYAKVFPSRFEEIVPQMLRKGFSRALLNGSSIDLEEWAISTTESAPMYILMDSFSLNQTGETKSRIRLAVEEALTSTGIVSVFNDGDENLVTKNDICGSCGSANSPFSKSELFRFFDSLEDSDSNEYSSDLRILIEKQPLSSFLALTLSKLFDHTVWAAILKRTFSSPAKNQVWSFLVKVLPNLNLRQDFDKLSYSQRSILSLASLLLSEKRGAIHVIDDLLEGLPEVLSAEILSLCKTTSENGSTVVCSTVRDLPASTGLSIFELSNRAATASTKKTDTFFSKAVADLKLDFVISQAKDIELSISPGEIVAIPGFLEISKMKFPEIISPFLRIAHGEVLSPGSRTLLSVSQYTGLINPIAELFAKVPAARTKGYTSEYFSLNPKSPGRCLRCQKVTDDVNSEISIQKRKSCAECGGSGFRSEIHGIKFKGVSFPELLGMPIVESSKVIQNVPKCGKVLWLLSELHLDHLTLRTPLYNLSHGELANLALVKTFDKPRSNILYILDQPGLKCSSDTLLSLISILETEIKSDNSLIILENNPLLLSQIKRVVSSM